MRIIPTSLKYFDAYFTVNGVLGVIYKRYSLAGESTPLGKVLRVHNLTLTPILFLLHACGCKCEFSAFIAGYLFPFCSHHCGFPLRMGTIPLPQQLHQYFVLIFFNDDICY